MHFAVLSLIAILPGIFSQSSTTSTLSSLAASQQLAPPTNSQAIRPPYGQYGQFGQYGQPNQFGQSGQSGQYGQPGQSFAGGSYQSGGYPSNYGQSFGLQQYPGQQGQQGFNQGFQGGFPNRPFGQQGRPGFSQGFQGQSQGFGNQPFGQQAQNQAGGVNPAIAQMYGLSMADLIRHGQNGTSQMNSTTTPSSAFQSGQLRL